MNNLLFKKIHTYFIYKKPLEQQLWIDKDTRLGGVTVFEMSLLPQYYNLAYYMKGHEDSLADWNGEKTLLLLVERTKNNEVKISRLCTSPNGFDIPSNASAHEAIVSEINDDLKIFEDFGAQYVCNFDTTYVVALRINILDANTYSLKNDLDSIFEKMQDLSKNNHSEAVQLEKILEIMHLKNAVIEKLKTPIVFTPALYTKLRDYMCPSVSLLHSFCREIENEDIGNTLLKVNHDASAVFLEIIKTLPYRLPTLENAELGSYDTISIEQANEIKSKLQKIVEKYSPRNSQILSMIRIYRNEKYEYYELGQFLDLLDKKEINVNTFSDEDELFSVGYRYPAKHTEPEGAIGFEHIYSTDNVL